VHALVPVWQSACIVLVVGLSLLVLLILLNEFVEELGWPFENVIVGVVERAMCADAARGATTIVEVHCVTLCEEQFVGGIVWRV